MDYVKKTIIIMVCAMLAFPNAILAKEEGIFCVNGYISRKDEKVMPKSSAEFEKMARQKVEMLNAIENFEIPNQEKLPETSTTLTFYKDENGEINYELTLPPIAKNPGDSSQEDASPEEDENEHVLDNYVPVTDDGQGTYPAGSADPTDATSPTSTTPLSENIKDKSDNIKPPPTLPDEPGPDQDPKPEPLINETIPPDKPQEITVAFGDPDLEKTMRKRFDFGKFTEDVEGVNDRLRKTFSGYGNSTDEYYAAVRVKFESLRSQSVNLNEYFPKGFVNEKLNRKLLDDAVAYVIYEAERNPDDEALQGFVAFELRERKSLKLGKEIYNREVKEILEYLNDIIDQLLASDVTVYGRSGKTLIKLPRLELKPEELEE